MRKINSSASVASDETLDRPYGGCSAAQQQHSAAVEAFVPPQALRIASSNAVVLITGETGVGKGWLARWMHEHSPHAARPFIPVNCGAIPEALIDSHLFGHARGAFSGAEREHDGLVRAAEGGTLLLDEIADLPLTAQTRLLRLLEEREVQPVGYSRPVTVNVRIIAATSADLASRVDAGTFREDLMFRLDVLRLHLAPLRERREHIPMLVNRFNLEFARLYRKHPLRFTVGAMRLLERHEWQGNVREVRTLIERLHVLCGQSEQDGIGAALTPDDLAGIGRLAAHRMQHVVPAAARLQERRVETAQDALKACAGNMSEAAQRLGVHRSTLYRWLADEVGETA